MSDVIIQKTGMHTWLLTLRDRIIYPLGLNDSENDVQYSIPVTFDELLRFRDGITVALAQHEHERAGSR